MGNTKNKQVTIRHKKLKENCVLYKRSGKKKILFGFVFVIFALYAISLTIPFLVLLINSFKGGLEYLNDLNAGRLFRMPEEFMLKNYASAFSSMRSVNSVGEYIYLPEMVFNTIWYSVLSVFSGIVASTITGYCLAKYKFRLRAILYGIAIFSMTIPIVGSTGAFFKLIHNLGLYNNPLYAIVASFGGFGFNFLILYGFFSNVSWSYAESVFIDGGGHFTAFFRIMLPQALPPILTLVLMAFIGCWNDYMTMLLYLPDYSTLASGLYLIQQSITRGESYPVYYAGLIISVIPMIILFVCFSNTIMQNFTIGGLKG